MTVSTTTWAGLAGGGGGIVFGTVLGTLGTDLRYVFLSLLTIDGEIASLRRRLLSSLTGLAFANSVLAAGEFRM